MPRAYSDKDGNKAITFSSPGEFFQVLFGTVYDAHVTAWRQRKWLDQQKIDDEARYENVKKATQEIIERFRRERIERRKERDMAV